mmetsp:Transcript_10404/g.40473  ORF Transcript_10404/g.40473 Transcript_10404/m.40473 type:complete len:215 (+) Transcript_10404:168-812(+)
MLGSRVGVCGRRLLRGRRGSCGCRVRCDLAPSLAVRAGLLGVAVACRGLRCRFGFTRFALGLAPPGARVRTRSGPGHVLILCIPVSAVVVVSPLLIVLHRPPKAAPLGAVCWHASVGLRAGPCCRLPGFLVGEEDPRRVVVASCGVLVAVLVHGHHVGPELARVVRRIPALCSDPCPRLVVVPCGVRVHGHPVARLVVVSGGRIDPVSGLVIVA